MAGVIKKRVSIVHLASKTLTYIVDIVFILFFLAMYGWNFFWFMLIGEPPIMKGGQEFIHYILFNGFIGCYLYTYIRFLYGSKIYQLIKLLFLLIILGIPIPFFMFMGTPITAIIYNDFHSYVVVSRFFSLSIFLFLLIVSFSKYKSLTKREEFL